MFVLTALALAADPVPAPAPAPLTFEAVSLSCAPPKPSIEILQTRIDVSGSVDVQIQADVTKRLDTLVKERALPKP
jgi:hypothetical protein